VLSSLLFAVVAVAEAVEILVVLATLSGPGTASMTTSLVGAAAMMMEVIMTMGLVVVNSRARTTLW
jgi:hypothetical protein